MAVEAGVCSVLTLATTHGFIIARLKVSDAVTEFDVAVIVMT